ncbi:MAG: PAS domain-containing protein [Pirellulales bacterium]|nr:PAS domain-containing protein [Pirellulales bacterium]
MNKEKGKQRCRERRAKCEELTLALKMSEERLALTSSAAGLGLLDWDLLKNETSWTTQLERMLGHTSETFGITAHAYREWTDHIFVEDLPLYEERMRSAMTERNPFEIECRVVWPDETIRWISIRGEFYFDDDGQATRMFGVVNDVTQQVKAEEAMRESEQRYRTVADFTYDWELWTNPQGQFVYCSPSCKRMTGHAPAEFLADSNLLRRLIHPDDLSLFDEHMRCCENRREPGESEWRLVQYEGTWRWVAHACQPVFDEFGQYLGVRSSTRDITDRKQAEEKLRESEERLALAFQATQDGIWDWNLETNSAFYSSRWKQMLGYVENEIAPHVDAWKRLIHPQDKERVRRLIESVMRGKQEYEIEFRLQHKDGHYMDILSRGFPIRREASGPVVRIVGTHFDLTERKRAENELKAMTETLEQRVTERTRVIQMLHDVASMVNRAQNVEQAIQYCLQRLSSDGDWCMGHALLPATDNREELESAYFYIPKDRKPYRHFREMTHNVRLRRGQGLPGRVFASGKPEWTTDIRQEMTERREAVPKKSLIGTAVAFPVIVGEKVVAVLEFISDQAIAPDEKITETMMGVGIQLSRIIERTDFEEHLLTIAEEIQRDIAQDLHDDVGQELTGLGLKTETLVEKLASAERSTKKLVTDIANAVERTRSKVRRFSRRMLPRELEEGLLVVALNQLAVTTTAGSRIACKFKGPPSPSAFESRIAMHLYRIAQEAVANAVRHSGAKNIRLSLDQKHNEIFLRIEDDGKGMPCDLVRSEGMGLRTMGYRAGLIGAILNLCPRSGGGTKVECRLMTKANS